MKLTPSGLINEITLRDIQPAMQDWVNGVPYSVRKRGASNPGNEYIFANDQKAHHYLQKIKYMIRTVGLDEALLQIATTLAEKDKQQEKLETVYKDHIMYCIQRQQRN